MGIDNLMISHCEDCRMFVVTSGGRFCAIKEEEIKATALCKDFVPIMEGEKPYCVRYCGITCVNGSCPKAMADDDRYEGLIEGTSCARCRYYKGCEDCAFEGTDVCPDSVK